MRWFKLVPVALMFAAPLTAQEFHGTVSMRMTDAQGQTVDTKVYVGRDKQAMVMTTPSGPMAGTEMRIVINPAANRVTILMATDMIPGSKGMKVVNEIGAAPGPSTANASPTAKPLGTSQTIAGMRCDDYEVTADGMTYKLCVTEALGRFTLPDMSANARGPQRPGWMGAFGNRPVFPLKLSSNDGKLTMEVTSVVRGMPAAALFEENPEGYTTPPGMPGMPGPRRN